MDIKNFNALAISHLRNFKVQNFHLDFIKENEFFDKIPPTINADYLLLKREVARTMQRTKYVPPDLG